MFERLKIKFFILKNLFVFYLAGVKVGKSLMVMGPIKLVVRGQLIIGDNLNVISGNMMNPLGRNLKTCIRVDEKAEILIGNNVGMSCVSIWSREKITIGNNVKLGGNVILFDSDMHSLDYKLRRNVETDSVNAKSAAVVIEDDVFIGASSIITKGVRIGQRSIVAAGSVVAKSIPENEIWGGNPAKFIRKI
ncbi:hypothetical protein B4Q04_00750 [Zobellia sp. OII3]|uniref:acyltransferase n=1 Tax=Zobellia sp. OII3 TaxID=2034520 RepID=UPI000B532E70|nr:acyltransferase [Zobellia sp. OII3]OWW26246.1 hypothetical protein B4Q04_00750 [Zobellia sp. OII3]